MPYELYVNRPNSIITIHEAECSHLRQHGGFSGLEHPTGWYVTGLGTETQTANVAYWLEERLGFVVFACTECGTTHLLRR